MSFKENVIYIDKRKESRFVVVPVWVDDALSSQSNQPSKRQKATIAIRNLEGFHVIHPVSEFIINWKWKYRSFNTQRKHATNVVNFLNYLVSVKGSDIKSLTQLDIKTGNDYLNDRVKKGVKRGTIIDDSRTLTSFYVWLSSLDCLDNVEESYIRSKRKENQYNNKHYYDSLFSPILPEKTHVKKRHLLPTKYIPLLFEISILHAHPIAFGLYLQVFGGLRAGEVVNLKRTQFRKKLGSGDFVLDLKENQLRTDIKDSSGSSYVKKNRTQQVLSIKDWGDTLFREHVDFYGDKDKNNTGALFINRNGDPMSGKSYSQYFYKIKDKFIEYLQKYGDSEDKIIASDLRLASWGTHIGRGTFTNLIAEEANDAADLMFMRGDSSLLSSLPYLENTERVRKRIEEQMNHMHNEYIPSLVDREAKKEE